MNNIHDQIYQLGILTNHLLQGNHLLQAASPQNNFNRPQFIQPVVTPTPASRANVSGYAPGNLNYSGSPFTYNAVVHTTPIHANNTVLSSPLLNLPLPVSTEGDAAQTLNMYRNNYNGNRRNDSYGNSPYPRYGNRNTNEGHHMTHTPPVSYSNEQFGSSQGRSQPRVSYSPSLPDPRLATQGLQYTPVRQQPLGHQEQKGLKRQYDEPSQSSSRKRQRSEEGDNQRQVKYPALLENVDQNFPGSDRYSPALNQNRNVLTRRASESSLSTGRSSPIERPSSATSSNRNYSTQALNPAQNSLASRDLKRRSNSPLLSLNTPPVKIPPAEFTGFEEISAAIWANFVNCRQSEALYQKKLNLRNALFSMIKGIFPQCGLYVVGSSMSGFGNERSDMDMCVMVTEGRLDQKKAATEVLRVLHKAVRKCSFIKHSELIRAKVPILKFKDTVSGIECDININNLVGIRNTHLLAFYAKADWRVRPLVLYVKRWAKFHNINDASRCTISSYSLVLMVIHYLQAGCDEPVLPSLQDKFPAKFNPNSDVRIIRLDEDVPPYNSLNKQSLGELFIGFLRYYTEDFNFDNSAISIRLGTKVPIQTVITMSQQSHTFNPSQWKYLCIEEPFDMSNTARSVYDGPTFQRVKAVFGKSYRTLQKTRDVKTIMTVPF